MRYINQIISPLFLITLIFTVSISKTNAAELNSPAAENEGQYVKCENKKSYFLDTDNLLHFIPNSTTLASWTTKTPAFKKIKCKGLKEGNQLTMRPGKFLIKIGSSSKLYVLSENNVLREIRSRKTLSEIFGPKWNSTNGTKKTISKTAAKNYKIGEPIKKSEDYDRKTELTKYENPLDLFRKPAKKIDQTKSSNDQSTTVGENATSRDGKETAQNTANIRRNTGAPSAPPDTPSGITATGGAERVTLSWTAISGATSYTIKRSLTSGGPYTTVSSTVTNNSYINSGIYPSTTYYYVISATNSLGQSSNSAEVSATTSAPTDLWPMDLIEDATIADCQFTAQANQTSNGQTMNVWTVNYVSYEWLNGNLHPIRIKGYATRPAALTGTIPGIVSAHGFGSEAALAPLMDSASFFGAMMISFSGPGTGTTNDTTSEGLSINANNGRHLYDTVPDQRGSWLWGHSVAQMRGLTCLAARSDVDSSKLGVTGYSLGSVASLLTASADDRVVAAVSKAGSLAFDVLISAPGNWLWGQLNGPGFTTSSPEVIAFTNLISQNILSSTDAKILMVNGTTDEFFPIPAFNTTFQAIGNSNKRSGLSANFDHGSCYTTSGTTAFDTAIQIGNRQTLHMRYTERMWFRHWLNGDSTYSVLPQAPTATITAIDGSSSSVTATVDEGNSNVRISEVRVWWSSDRSLYYYSSTLSRQSSGVFTGTGSFNIDDSNTIAFVDVTYATYQNNVATGYVFALSSLPTIPSGYVPLIRLQSNCQVPS